MKKGRVGRIFLVTALSATLIGGSLPAYAVVPQVGNELSIVQPRYTGIRDITCKLSISSDGNASCLGRVKLDIGYDSEFTLALQRRTSGRPWSDVTSWTDSGTSTLSESRYVTSGYDYRCELTVDVYSSSGKHVATYTKHSDIVPY